MSALIALTITSRACVVRESEMMEEALIRRPDSNSKWTAVPLPRLTSQVKECEVTPPTSYRLLDGQFVMLIP